MSSRSHAGQAQDRGDERVVRLPDELDKNTHDLQRKLRKIILACLGILNVEDHRLAPALQRLSALIEGFELRAKADVSVAAGGMHWAKLKAAMNPTDSSLPATTKKRRIRRRCEHGLEPWDCRHCRPCPHGKIRKHCEKCCGCPHGKLKFRCKKCSPCPHGRLKFDCAKCHPCPHGKLRKCCVRCVGCPHGKLKTNCRLCLESVGCPHGKLKKNCSLCTGCEHGRPKTKCKVCRIARQRQRIASESASLA